MNAQQSLDEYRRLMTLLEEAERTVKAQRQIVQAIARLFGVCLECGQMKAGCSCAARAPAHD